ncbi:MAG: BON domain-containing protein [Proteobacteria bacterium]|nr:BON domain-containing protein [Pseudomonadota bacterium]
MKKTMYRLALIVIAASLFLINDRLFASETDDRIESSAKQSYVFKTYLKDDDIKIQSKDGAVTLTGIVLEESRKGLARETVAGLPGVKSVDNRLEVKGASPTPNSDAWVGEKVKATLLYHRNVNGINTKVQVNNGIVTLRGEASSKAQKQLTTEYARDVDGVKTVKNEMTVLTAAMKPGQTTMGEKMNDVSESMDDASITGQVKMSLLFHRSTSAQNTKAETTAGVVTLYGKADNAAEKALVTKLVNDINGVKRVNNRMTIAGKKKSTEFVRTSAVDYTENQIKELQGTLKITGAQKELWNNLTQVMRENAKEMDALNRDRAENTKPMNAVEHMKFHSQITEAHLDQMMKLIPPFEAFYASLTDEQKNITDTTFRTGKYGKSGRK